MNKRIVFFLILMSLFINSAFALDGRDSCNTQSDSLKALINFGMTSNNVGLVLTCCGNNSSEQGIYLKEHQNSTNYTSCLNRFKNGIPNSYSPKLSPMECIGAGLSQAWESLKNNASGLWDMLSHPVASASEITEFGKLLLSEEGRSQIYNLIRQSIEDKARDYLTCLTRSEKEEALCKMAGAFASNFIPPAILIKALLTTMKTGRAGILMSEMAEKVAQMKKKPLIKTTSIKKIFTFEEIQKNAKLSDRDRIDTFEKMLGKAAGSFSRNKAMSEAILSAHNQSGTIGKLTFSEIKSRVLILKKAGFSDQEIRMGLDAGIFGNLEQVADPVLNLSHLENKKLENAKVLTRIDDTKHTSGQTIFKGDNNEGIEILESNGEKVFSKIKYDPNKKGLDQGQLQLIKESFTNESKFAKILSDLGIGAKFKGVYKGNDGKFRIATEYIEGFEVHLGETPADIKKLKLSTIYQMKEKAMIAIKNGIDPFDLQFRVGHDGVPHIIDPEHFSFIKPEQQGEAIKTIEDDFSELIKDKVKSR
jgi:hypothetical protein